MSKFYPLLLLGCFILLTLKSQAEGSRELEPQNAPNRVVVGGGALNFAGYNAPADSRLAFSILRPNRERVYLGFGDVFVNNSPSGANFRTGYFRVKDPDGQIVYGPAQIPGSGQPGYIASKIQTVAGPSAINANGYPFLTFMPQKAGDYYIEFSDNLNNQGSTGLFLRYFDITVFDQLTAQVKLGRLYSKLWVLNTENFQNPTYGKFYVYTPDSIVTRFDMNGIQPFGYEVMCNRTGCTNTGDVVEDRKSRGWRFLYPEYKIFLNNPDEEIYPSGLGPVEITSPVEIKGCPLTGYCINMSINKPSNAEVYLELNGTPGFQTGTADRLIEAGLDEGDNCVQWDGKNGLGQPVLPGTTVDVRVSVISGLTNFPINDAENNRNGMLVDLIRPVNQQVRIFWDDSRLPNGTQELNGCQGACRSWPNNFGNNRTMNTWWYTGKVDRFLTYVIVENCPVFANDDYDTTTFETPITIDILANDNDPDNNLDTSSLAILSGPNNGTAVLVNNQLVYTPNPGFLCNDTLYYILSDFGPSNNPAVPVYTDTAMVVITVLPPSLPITNTTFSQCAGPTLTVDFGIQATSNFTLRWYGNATGGNPFATPAQVGINTAVAGQRVLFVSQSLPGATCEAPRIRLAVNVLPNPNPAFTGLPDTMCLGESATLVPASSVGSFVGSDISGNVFSPTAAGTFTIIRNNDNASCPRADTQTVFVSLPPLATFSGLEPVYCAGSPPVTITPTLPGGTFTGTVNGSNVFNPSTPGVFTVTYTIGDGRCTATETLQVLVGSDPDASFTGLPTESCFSNRPINLNPITPGGIFFVNNAPVAGNNFVPDSPGNYEVKYALTVNRCYAESTQSILVKEVPNSSFSGLAPEYCENSAPVTLQPLIPGGTFQGPNIVNGQFIPGAVGTYSVSYILVNTVGCPDTTTQTVEVKPVPNPTFSGIPATVCATGQSYALTPATAGGIFLVNGSAITGNNFIAQTPGQFTITYTVSQNGCGATASTTITVAPLPDATFTGLGTTYCSSNGPVTLQPSTPGGTFTGTGITGNVFDPSAVTGPAVITYTVTSAAGCVRSAQQTVNVTVTPNPAFAILPPSICAGSPAISLNPATAGGTFLLNGNPLTTGSFDPSTPGGYTLTHTVTNGNCTAEETQIITVLPSPSAAFTGLNPAYCEGDAPVTLVPSQTGGAFSGTGVSGTSFNPIVPGTYPISYGITNAQGCTDTIIQTVTVNPIPDANFAPLPAVVCTSNDLLILQANVPGGTFSGQGVIGGTFSPSAEGDYVITYSLTQNGCSSSSTQSISVRNPLDANFTLLQPGYCQGTSGIAVEPVNAGGTFSGPVSNGLLQTDTPGDYEITYTLNNNGCLTFARQIVSIYPLPTIEGQREYTIIVGETAETDLVSDIGQITWTRAEGLLGAAEGRAFLNPQVSTTYQLTARTPQGCETSTTVQVNVRQLLAPANVLTPNNDGFNDTWIIGNLEDHPNTKVVITNRWGQQVYSHDDYRNNWDGSGLPAGTYFYQVSTSAAKLNVRGWVQIVK